MRIGAHRRGTDETMDPQGVVAIPGGVYERLPELFQASLLALLPTEERDEWLKRYGRARALVDRTRSP